MQLVHRALLGQPGDHGIEVAMLAPQFVELAQQRVPVH
jgi:hypothetical protein